jgi:hypothetical protein
MTFGIIVSLLISLASLLMALLALRGDARNRRELRR